MVRLLFVLPFVSLVAWSEPVHPTLIGGRVADPSQFPASVWTRSCSATVVGERAVFIAAHCVQGNGRIEFNAGPNRYTATCSVSRDYASNNTADYAMCLTSSIIVGIPYEHLNTDASRLGVGDSVLLTGYGCTQPGGLGGNDGIYRIGEARIAQLPSGASNDIVTNSGAALCYGDSGGPAFYQASNGMRYVISTNSRGNISTTSYLSAIHTAQGKRFLDAWAQQSGQRLCGVHSDARGCRGTSNPEPGSPEFAIERPWISIRGKLAVGYEQHKDSVMRAIGDLVDNF